MAFPPALWAGKRSAPLLDRTAIYTLESGKLAMLSGRRIRAMKKLVLLTILLFTASCSRGGGESLVPQILTERIPSAVLNRSYRFHLEGAVNPLLREEWAVKDGRLPAGIRLTSDGWLEGTPTELGDFTFTVQLLARGATFWKTAEKNFTLTVHPKLEITATALPDAYDGQEGYSAQLTATGGRGSTSYSWSIVSGSGSLPPNLVLDSSGLISGDVDTTASFASPYSFTVEVTDGIQTAQANLSITVWQRLQITTTSLRQGYEGQSGYSVTLTAVGGNSVNYVWSMSGTLPSNLSWDAVTATISGDIATGTAGDYPLQFEVTDGIQTATVNLTLTVYAELQITTTTLPDAYEGVLYSYTLNATGGNPRNYNWSISGQPPWLAIDAATGELRGTPPSGSAGNTYTFTVEVTDGQQAASKQFVLAVGSKPIAPKADFEASPTYGTAPLTVTFTDKSTGTITQWEWDFDNDGNVDSTVQNPTYIYSNPGWYTVKLTVTGPLGSDTLVKERYILVVSNVYYVDGVNGNDANGGTGWGDAFATIGKALSVAGDYAQVLVADATYNETNLNFNGKKIYLKGVDHNTAGAQPVIDCQNSGRAFYFGSGETKDSVIDNFVIQNGEVKDTYGGAIVCENGSSPTITNCIFRYNRAEDTNGWGDDEHGGAIYCDGSSPTVVNCIFSDNSANYRGGAIRCHYSSPTLNNCILWGNSATLGGNEIYIYDSDSSCTLNYCCVDNTGYGFGSGVPTTAIDDSNNCIYDDPQFADAANGDYHLKSTSPCIDAGDNGLVPAGVTTDLDGNPRVVDGDNDGTPVVDIGAYEKQ
ncbi:MAG: hypothetical protein DRP63_05240 [Planctomycetota bacterium]|nr:MAG: hypothetical protein DRP63_05240 [Planctomycetota bacterium]